MEELGGQEKMILRFSDLQRWFAKIFGKTWWIERTTSRAPSFYYEWYQTQDVGMEYKMAGRTTKSTGIFFYIKLKVS